MIKINERWVQLQMAAVGIPKGRAREYLACMIMLDPERKLPMCELYNKTAEQMGMNDFAEVSSNDKNLPF